jgi:hypothetical protein
MKPIPTPPQSVKEFSKALQTMYNKKIQLLRLQKLLQPYASTHKFLNISVSYRFKGSKTMYLIKPIGENYYQVHDIFNQDKTYLFNCETQKQLLKKLIIHGLY